MCVCKYVSVIYNIIYITCVYIAWSPLLQVSMLKPRSADDRDVRMTLLSIPGDACP